MNKVVEKIIFVLLNLVLSCAMFIGHIIFLSTIYLNPCRESFKFLEDPGIYWAIYIFFISIYVVWYLKIKIFSFLYKAEKFFPQVHKFLNRFLEESSFRDKIFVSAFVLDIAIIIVSAGFGSSLFAGKIIYSLTFEKLYTICLLTILLGGGVLTGYIAFFLSER